MPEFVFDFDQGSDQWIALRRGVLGSHNAHRLTTAQKRHTYALQKTGELLAHQAVESGKTDAMEWGNEYEQNAKLRYKLETESRIQPVGFVWMTGYEGLVGVSPDGLVDEDGTIEIKCPLPKTHVEHWIDGPPMEYLWQMQMVMLVCERKWCDFISFDPRMNPPADFLRRRYLADKDMHEMLRSGIDIVLKQMDDNLKSIGVADALSDRRRIKVRQH